MKYLMVIWVLAVQELATLVRGKLDLTTAIKMAKGNPTSICLTLKMGL